jgi:hypothetical protein
MTIHAEFAALRRLRTPFVVSIHRMRGNIDVGSDALEFHVTIAPNARFRSARNPAPV